MTLERTTRKKSIEVRGIKFSEGYLDEIGEIIIQDVEEKNLNISNDINNLYQIIQILVMVILGMIPWLI